MVPRAGRFQLVANFVWKSSPLDGWMDAFLVMHLVNIHSVNIHLVDVHSVNIHLVDIHSVDMHLVDIHSVNMHVVNMHLVDMHLMDILLHGVCMGQNTFAW